MNIRRDAPRVLALLPDKSGPAVWRVLWPFTALERQGFGAWWCPLDDPRAAQMVNACEAVVLPRLAWQPEHFGKAQQWVEALHAAGLAVILEVDDDLFSPACLPQTTLMGQAHEGKGAEQVALDRHARIQTLRLMDGVTTTTPRLARAISQYADIPVEVIPNAIDLQFWEALLAQVPRTDSRLTIGWAGGRRLDADLEAMAVAWARIAARYPQVAFKLAGYAPELLTAAVPADRLTVEPWRRLEEYPLGYAHVDIGCAPLAPNPFNFCKTPIKAYEWAAAGAAVVASPTVYAEAMRSEIDGLFATSAQDWEDALARLIEDDVLRRTMARRWGKRVREHFSLAVNLYRWPEAWQRIITRYRARSLSRGLVLV